MVVPGVGWDKAASDGPCSGLRTCRGWERRAIASREAEMIYLRQQETPGRNQGYSSTRRAPVRLTYLLLPRTYSKHAAWSNGRRCPFSREGSVTRSQFKTHVQKNRIFAFIIIGKVARGGGTRTTKPRSAKIGEPAGAGIAGRIYPPRALIQGQSQHEWLQIDSGHLPGSRAWPISWLRVPDHSPIR
jgi:hypothetical protein